MPLHRLGCGALICAALALPLTAAASCGADFCTINTNWDAQGAWAASGARLGLRFEYVKQDQPRHGRRKVAVGEISGHHDEVFTRNRNLIASLDYGLNADWAISAALPVVDREHLHIHNHRGAQLLEAWNFSGVGDARVLAHRRGEFLGMDFGLKLPTGKHDERNDEGTLAERSLQPSSGTVDALLGAHTGQALRAKDLSWFAQTLLQLPLDYREGYRPGRRLSLDLGLRYEAGERLGLMLQLNALFKGRDRGPEAEPENSGGSALFVGPGVSYSLTQDVQAYGFLQLPLYQYVNGVQLTARRAMVVGLSGRF